MKHQLKRGERYKIHKTISIILDGDVITSYDDNIGDVVEIVEHVVDEYYDVKNITKGYGQYVPISILEKIA